MTSYAELRALAEKATPGPWKHGPLYWEVWNLHADGTLDSRVAGSWLLPDDGAYIAAVDPQSILALLDDLDAAQAALTTAPLAVGAISAIAAAREKALDAAQAAIRGLADRVDQTQKPAPWEGFQWRPGDKERLREWNLAVASIQRWIEEGPHAPAIAAAREGAPK